MNFSTKYKIAKFLSLAVWLGEIFYWTLSGASVLAVISFPFSIPSFFRLVSILVLELERVEYATSGTPTFAY